MKRYLPVLLMVCLLISGCDSTTVRIKEPVTFYYVQADYTTDLSSPLGTEQREAAGHREDLSYLLALYLMGPSQENLVSPLPASTQIISVQETEPGIRITLSDTTRQLTEGEFSLACACLTLTCLDLTDAEVITITSGKRSVSMSRNNLVLFDSGTPATTEETT